MSLFQITAGGRSSIIERATIGVVVAPAKQFFVVKLSQRKPASLSTEAASTGALKKSSVQPDYRA